MAKTNCESLPALTTAYLLKSGFFRGGGVASGKIVWSSRWGEDVAASVSVWLGDSPRLTLDGQSVALTATTPHFGGRRWWLSCPFCRRRVAVIYLARSIACRRCFGLCYRSQLEAHGKGKAGDFIRNIKLCFPKPNEDPDKIRYKRWRGRPTKRIARLEEKHMKLLRQILRANRNL